MNGKIIHGKPRLTLKSFLLRNHNWLRFYETFKNRIRDDIVYSIVNLLSCRNIVRGYSEFICENPNCTHSKKICFSCKNRACSSCGKKATAVWIQKQVKNFPETTYQHITLTMPEEFWDLFWLNRFLFNSICSLAAGCVKTIAKTHGIKPGIFLALHSFGRNLKRHVHIHLCTTLGGLDKNNNEWKELPKIKKEIIMPIWRARLIKLLRKTYQKGILILPKAYNQLQNDYKAFNQFLDFHYRRYWHVYCSKPEKQYHRNIEYLARYVKRPPIANSRLIHYNSTHVKFWYYDHKNRQKRIFKCSPFEFIQRVIQHIPDKGFRIIRYYGFLANALRGKLLPIVNKLLNLQKESFNYVARYTELMQLSFNFNPLKCILCGSMLRLSNICFGSKQIELIHFHKQLALMKPCR